MLYPHDGHTLYRINPVTGKSTKISDLALSSTDGACYGGMTYDRVRHKLYASVWLPSRHGTPAVSEIDPADAKDQVIWQGTDGYPPRAVSYDPAHDRLYFYCPWGQGPAHLYPFDPQWQQFGDPTIALYVQQFFGLEFDRKGRVWSYGSEGDNLATLIELPGLGQNGKILKVLDVAFPTLAPDHIHSAPRYWFLTFQPYTQELFALAIPAKQLPPEPDGKPGGWSLDLWHYMLCTINLQTGKPKRIIQMYNTDPDHPSGITIAWGLAHAAGH